jgi:large subunit ribosomal protein L20
MSRVKRGVTSHAKHKKVYKAAKGFRGRRKNTIRAAKAAVEKAGQYAFRDRKRKKRTFRALWIQRINAAVRPFGMTYSVFINGLSKSGITVDRKVLSGSRHQRAVAFQAIAEKAKAAAGGLTVPHDSAAKSLKSVHGRMCASAPGSRPSTLLLANAVRRG